MKKISSITEDLKEKILEFLYHDEMYNAMLIELIQNNIDILGELYIFNENEGSITNILHISFAEITSVYIDTAYRNRGFGKEIIGHMTDIAIQEQKTPILVTSISNTAAMKTYETMGFERQREYVNEFLD